MRSILLPPATCDLWIIDLDAPTTVGAVAGLLDEGERERAARLRSPRDRERFAACRGALRKLLAQYLHQHPAQLAFRRGEHGKPYLVDPCNLQFNVTHSGNLGLIAVSTHEPLGIDVEELHEVPRATELAQRYFHPAELHLLQAAAPEERSQMFLTCWTRKEAVLKSTGAGLTRNTQLLNVGVAAEENLLHLPQFPPLRVISLAPMEGYVGACAAIPDVQHFKYHRFEP